MSDSAEVRPDAVLLDQVNADLGAVDDALRRLDDGTYGTCEVCGAHLDPQRLQENPLLTLCPVHRLPSDLIEGPGAAGGLGPGEIGRAGAV